MNRTQLRKLISRLLRHSGFDVHMNKESQEYEFFINGRETPIMYCKTVTEEEEGITETYLCFRVKETLSPEHNKLYERMKGRFSRLAPEIGIDLENESEPIFTKEQLEKVEELCQEYNIDTQGDNNEE